MEFKTAFWILMLLWLITGGVVIYPSSNPRSPYILGGNFLLLFLLILILGWKMFGQPLHQ